MAAAFKRERNRPRSQQQNRNNNTAATTRESLRDSLADPTFLLSTKDYYRHSYVLQHYSTRPVSPPDLDQTPRPIPRPLAAAPFSRGMSASEPPPRPRFRGRVHGFKGWGRLTAEAAQPKAEPPHAPPVVSRVRAALALAGRLWCLWWCLAMWDVHLNEPRRLACFNRAKRHVSFDPPCNYGRNYSYL